MTKRVVHGFCIILFWLVSSGLNAKDTSAPEKSRFDAFAGLTEQDRSSIQKMILDTEPVRSGLRGSRYRIFGTQSTGVKTAEGLRRYAYTLIYDYSRNKTYQIINDVSAGIPGKILEINNPAVPPPPTAEEYAEARQIAGSLQRVKLLLSKPKVILQDSFPIESPAPCDINRCVEVQVNEIIPGVRLNFLLLVTVDLSTRQVVEVRDPKTPTAIR
jgi:hypothetical protein